MLKQILISAVVSAVVVFALAWADGKWGILPEGPLTGKPMA